MLIVFFLLLFIEDQRVNYFFDLFNIFNNLSHRYKHVIIGDLNCNLVSGNFESAYFREIVESSSLFIVPSDTTHHTATSDS